MTGNPTGLFQRIACPLFDKTFAHCCKKDIPNLAEDKTSPILSQITPAKKVQAGKAKLPKGCISPWSFRLTKSSSTKSLQEYLVEP